MLGGQASTVLLLPSVAQGRTSAEKGQLHVWHRRHPSSSRVLQHLRARGPATGLPYGSCGRAEAVQALTHAHPLCGPRCECAGRVPLMPWFLLGNSTPTIPPAPSAQAQQVPYGLADVADASGKKGSNVYEVNRWLWQFGRANLVWAPRLMNRMNICQCRRRVNREKIRAQKRNIKIHCSSEVF